ncbi:hypothetical protein F5Y12DRAFT_754285 [Xylaria sp. FL1777]|nr:hypothetical protein F5Y12DRAFT_754285 [Xylaria sp. FL1777]
MPSPIHPIKINKNTILQKRDLCASTILFLDDNIVIKIYNQFYMSDVDLVSGLIELEISYGDFVAKKWNKVYPCV